MQNEKKEYYIDDLKYILTRKKIKNINLRINKNGEISVSAPLRCPQKDITAFILQKKDWIIKSQRKLANANTSTIIIEKERTMEAQILFERISRLIFPLFADTLNGQLPQIKVRDMKSRWGVCHIKKRYITLNLQLLAKPYDCIEYVIMHEYAHFLVPNHSKKFWDIMQLHMPDYNMRRKMLNK